MYEISNLKRRHFLAAASATTLIGCSPRAGRKTSPTPQRTPSTSAGYGSKSTSEIVDLSSNTARPEILQALKSKGIKVVGRYYTRMKIPEGWRQEIRMIDNSYGGRSEVETLLANGFSILSIFQFGSKQENKFTHGISRVNMPGGEVSLNSGSAREEAKRDVDSFYQQARITRQPRGSAIYFTVDFNFTGGYTQVGNGILEYFHEVQRQLGNDYLLGVYGNGATQELLMQNGLGHRRWLPSSIAHSGTTRFYRSLKWDLFQGIVDVNLSNGYGCIKTKIDYNFANPRTRGLGVWGYGGNGLGNAGSIYDSHRFFTSCTSIYSGPGFDFGTLPETSCWQRNKGMVGRVVRVVGYTGEWAKVDLNELGTEYGYVHRSHLSSNFASMPDHFRC